MNGRIQELRNIAINHVLDNRKTNNLSLEVTEKYTELVLSDIENILIQYYNELPTEVKAYLLTLDERIKQHFYTKE